MRPKREQVTVAGLAGGGTSNQSTVERQVAVLS